MAFISTFVSRISQADWDFQTDKSLLVHTIAKIKMIKNNFMFLCQMLEIVIFISTSQTFKGG